MLRGLRILPLLVRNQVFPRTAAPFYFSQFFDKQDKKELSDFYINQHRKKYLYYSLVEKWKKPLQKKQKRRQRKQQLAIQRAASTPQPMEAKFIVHNPALGIQYPPQPNQQFAVIQVDGFQYKVMTDSLVLLDHKPQHSINQPIVFEKVPLIGTNSFTLLGRPFVGNARVEAVVESISDSQKVIVFKKLRRKGYKKSMGHRTPLTQCRITNIVYQLTEEILERAVSLT